MAAVTATSAPTRAGSPTWRHRVIPVLVLVGLMWVTEFVDLILPLDMDQLGIHPREGSHLVGIVLAPFLHAGFGHLISLVLGSLLALSTRHLWLVTCIVVALGGLGVWLLGGTNTVHLGASGVVYGYATFLAVYGFAARRPGQAMVGVLVIALYGWMVFGVLPIRAGVSWEGHLFGALAGGALALWLGRRERGGRSRSS